MINQGADVVRGLHAHKRQVEGAQMVQRELRSGAWRSMKSETKRDTNVRRAVLTVCQQQRFLTRHGNFSKANNPEVG